MQLKLLNILACPKCQGDVLCISAETNVDDEVVSGRLECKSCNSNFPIRSGIPRFVSEDNYTKSFGFQWNLFKYEQIDGNENEDLSERRFYSETGWTRESMKDKWILDAGCGAGRFLDIASRSGCNVVGIDMSNAVEAAAETMQGRRNVHLVQASIYELPFMAGAFDACYSLGVLQHTPDPLKAVKSLPCVLKEDGEIAVTIYERKPWTWINAKYLIRPITKRINKKALLLLIKMLMPVLYPLTSFLFGLPVMGRVFKFVIPVADYAHSPGLLLKQRYRCVTLDTFDMLSPEFDFPQTRKEVEAALSDAGVVGIKRLETDGLSLVGKLD